eukprot:355158-Chlamydomonas_euryale.AAC.6
MAVFATATRSVAAARHGLRALMAAAPEATPSAAAAVQLGNLFEGVPSTIPLAAVAAPRMGGANAAQVVPAASGHGMWAGPVAAGPMLASASQMRPRAPYQRRLPLAHMLTLQQQQQQRKLWQQHGPAAGRRGGGGGWRTSSAAWAAASIATAAGGAAMLQLFDARPAYAKAETATQQAKYTAEVCAHCRGRLVPGALGEVHGAWCMTHGARQMVQGACGTKCMAACAWCMWHGAWRKAYGAETMPLSA